MKKYCHIILAILLFAQSMTAVIGEPGGLGYELVIKPYPSLLKSVPGMEVSGWAAAISSGDIPEWVVKRTYLSIGFGDAELQPQLWERLYGFFMLLTIVFIFLSSVLASHGLYKICRSALTRRYANNHKEPPFVT